MGKQKPTGCDSDRLLYEHRFDDSEECVLFFAVKTADFACIPQREGIVLTRFSCAITVVQTAESREATLCEWAVSRQ